MPATKRGIYHNLKESEYTVSNTEIVFFFSSEVYLNKFLDNYEKHRGKFINNMERVAIDNILNMTTLADITFYKEIEKRGFRVTIRGLEVSWEELNQIAIRNMNNSKVLEWKRINKPNLRERMKYS